MAQNYYIYNNMMAVDGQTMVSVSKPYISGSLMVSLNGLLCKLGADADYVEIDETHIKFVYPLTSKDEVTIASVIGSDDISVQVISGNLLNPNSLFQKYGSVVKLLNNNIYNVEVKIKKKRYNWHFTSKYNPHYSTADKIRSDTGDLLLGVTDEQIEYLIYLNSKELNMIYKVNNIVDPVSATITPSVILQYKKSWVRYKTDLDLVNAAYLSISGVNGGVSKTIGEIKIEKKFNVPLLKQMIERFTAKFQGYDEFVQNKPMSQVFIRASQSSYPYSGRAGF